MLGLLLLISKLLLTKPSICLIDDVAKMKVHLVVVPVIRSQVASVIPDTEMVHKYVLVDSHMIEGVLLSLRIDKYQS